MHEGRRVRVRVRGLVLKVWHAEGLICNGSDEGARDGIADPFVHELRWGTGEGK